MKTIFSYFGFLILAMNLGCTAIATKTLKATGTIAKTTLQVGGEVTKVAVDTTLDIAGAAFRKSTVTLIDTTTGVSKKVPWSEGLKISSASQTAKLQTATRALEIMRGTKKIKATAETLLQSGDVVRLK